MHALSCDRYTCREFGLIPSDIKKEARMKTTKSCLLFKTKPSSLLKTEVGVNS